MHCCFHGHGLDCTTVEAVSVIIYVIYFQLWCSHHVLSHLRHAVLCDTVLLDLFDVSPVKFESELNHACSLWLNNL